MRELLAIQNDVYCIPVGNLLANCYIIKCGNDKALIIDPGDESPYIEKTLQSLCLHPIAIIITHVHFDHVGACYPLKEKYGIPVYMHYDDKVLIAEVMNWSSYLCDKYVPFQPDQFLNDEEVVEFEDKQIKVLLTPGHSPGSISLLFDTILFSGDVIFANGGFGRTDLWGGSYETIMTSLHRKILTLPENTVICPGHGSTSTIKNEKKYYEFRT
ncbi:MAG: MBL fold metallo-hydrolase [Candidatus Margulisiibacteriota bacterium]|nr:MAG: hypothetical protein A2X43_12140 [Candidatus Margulisbacteria bacterium GWD2_39_127]OGI03206.1 MAG: hypothetical protein A2X42_11380 [Candidatus Margulisbacteria bacterium GWF2_38_17]OGI11230.1 MAG: hypothetical protein A2X41_03805 [Candidatus Margulisbacteria bacterium GWE2_39_32]PZM78555.1 MAG: MBL fold metallo-hydrolase [Candidatus Margulisiibacteriota bacterium]HAR63878.1 MBL fold metallo-hydrolase [Candidatus Margulisiibacteriota bacterium]